MDEWLREFANWTTEEEELQRGLDRLKVQIESISPGISVVSIEEILQPSFPTQIVYIGRHPQKPRRKLKEATCPNCGQSPHSHGERKLEQGPPDNSPSL